MEKIDVSITDPLIFSKSANSVQTSTALLYKSGDYIGFIKSLCLGLFFSNCTFLFSMRGCRIPSCYIFPESGRDHTFQSFKKLGIPEKIPLFNESHLNFYKALTPDFERIVSTLKEHSNRWKALVKGLKAVDLIEQLQSTYKMSKDTLGSESRIYELYFIYENQYLHQQFDRFLSAKDFTDWWENDAVKILRKE